MRILPLLLMLTLLLGGNLPAEATDFTETGRIVVQGIGRVEVEPDQALLTFSARTLARTASEAIAEQARQVALANDVLLRLGIPARDVQTQHVGLREEWEFRQNERVFRGYVAEQRIRVTLNDLEQIGILIDALVHEAGIASIQDIQFRRRDREAAAEEALRAAYRHAASRARILADVSGVGTLRPVRILDQSSDTAPVTLPSTEMARLASFDAAGTTVQPGMLTVEARVHVEFAY